MLALVKFWPMFADSANTSFGPSGGNALIA
jgi:hypothetical protein